MSQPREKVKFVFSFGFLIGLVTYCNNFSRQAKAQADGADRI